MNYNRHFGGKRAKISGDEFENFLQNHSSKDLKVLRIPNGAKVRKGPKGLITTLVKSPFDFILWKGQNTVCLDAKSINQHSFPHSLIDRDQVLNLLSLSPNCINSGYLIYFRPIMDIVFFPAEYLIGCRGRGSLKSTEGLSVGTRFTLNLEKLFDQKFERKSI